MWVANALTHILDVGKRWVSPLVLPGVTKEEVEDVFQNATDADTSRSSGRPVIFGDTATGRHLMVVYEEIDADTVYPVTAYDVPRRQRP